ncbi:transposase [Colletotrichum tabaci]|uniref:Transposase n=1 Tax=Colletotrichum tabaci TaxID=1209068 RepID=A0AAV9T1A0_9PEZI
MVRYSEDELNQALEAISNGLSLRKASLQYGVPRSTLQLRLQGSQARSIAFSDLQRLSPSQEAKLAEWVRIQHALGLPPSHQQVKEFAGRILHAMGDTQPVGRGWIQAFIRRNPSVKVQRSRSIDSRRVNGASTEVIRDWFKHLAIPEIISIKPANRYNMDETGILEGQGSNGLVLGMSETKSVRKKQPGSRAWVSIIECISALGYVLNPLVIYKGKAVQQQWFPLDLSPYEGWQFTATENGWTSDATAVEWLQKVFIPQTLPQGKEVRLLIMDGHGSHTTTDFMWLCYINNIHLLFLPPHTSHVLQPLDQSVFSPVKSAYRKELGYLSQWNDSTIVGKRNFIGCYQKARTAGMTMQNIRSGWKWTGLWPVSMAKPLMSSLLLPTTPKPSASSDQVSKGQSGGKEGKEAEGWASASSAVVWSTPRKMKDLAGQLKLFTELDNDASTQRLLFIKVKKGFSEQSYNLATAQHKLELLQAQVNNTAVRKRRAVQIDPNTKFANIKDIQQAQIEAGDKEDDEAESSASDNPSEAGSCILALTLLRVGEANSAPFPPPAQVKRAPPNKAIDIEEDVISASWGDEPLGASHEQLENVAERDEVMAEHAGGEDTEVQQAIGHGRKREKIFGLLKGGAKEVVKAAATVDKIRAKTGSENARTRIGVVPSSNDDEQTVGPMEFSARYDGQKGFVYVNAVAGFVAFNKKSITEEDLDTVWAINIDGITQLRKHSGYGMKAKLYSGWATDGPIYDSLRIVDQEDKHFVVTALPYRDALFNRLCAISKTTKWEVW